MRQKAILLILLAIFPMGCTRGPEMVDVKGGAFLAGSAKLPTHDNPERSVKVGDFSMMRYEVTNREYEICVQVGACTPRPPISTILAGPEQPAVQVTWSQAAAFCAWWGMRLPTENEWEHAARGQKSFLYPWGDEFAPEAANGGYARAFGRGKKIYRFTAPPGSFPRDRSAWGAMDMAGNIAEWTADPYSPEPGKGAPPEDGNLRVVKGGYFYAEAHQLSGAWREPAAAEMISERIGFRCIK